jgi:sugar diacid utilization regulator
VPAEADQVVDFLVAVIHEVVHTTASPGIACCVVTSSGTTALCGDPAAAEAVLDAAAEAFDLEGVCEPLHLDLPFALDRGHSEVLMVPLQTRRGTPDLVVVGAPAGGLPTACVERLRELAGLGERVAGRMSWLSTDRDALANANADLRVRAAEASRLLEVTRHFDLADMSTGIDAMIERLAEFLQRPVVLQGSKLVELASACGSGSHSMPVPLAHRDRDLLASLAESREPLVTVDGDQVVVRTAVVGGGRCFGYLSVAATIDDDIDRVLSAVRHVAGLAAFERAIRDEQVVAGSALRDSLVADLLSGQVDEHLIGRAAELGHDLRRPHRSVAVGMATCGDAARTRIARAHLAATLADLGRDVLDARSAPLLAAVDDHMVVFLPTDIDRGIEAFANRVVTTAAAAGNEVVVALGPVTDCAADFAPAARKACWVLEVMAVEPGCAGVIDHEELGIYGLLFDKSDSSRLDDFVGRWIGPLLEYDAKRNGDLVQTLAALLDVGSMAETAAQLYIHISTLKYRAKRIEDILGVSLKDRKNGFNLHLALKIHEVRHQLLQRAT